MRGPRCAAEADQSAASRGWEVWREMSGVDGCFHWEWFQLYWTPLTIFLAAKLNKCKCGWKDISRQGYKLTLPVNKIVGGSCTDTGHFLFFFKCFYYYYFIANLFFRNVNVILWSVGSQSAHTRRYSCWDCCSLFFFFFSISSGFAILCSVRRVIDVSIRTGGGTHWMWPATWMGAGGDRGQGGCVWADGSACF